jgi:excisionase family DNA binding protein
MEIPETSEPMLTTADLAALFDVHERTILNWVRSGALPAVRVSPTMFRFEPAAVREFIQTRREAGLGTTDNDVDVLDDGDH